METDKSGLTGESQNAYSESMDPTRPDASPGASASPEAEAQALELQIRQRMQQQGLPVDRDSEQMIKQMARLAQAGVVDIPGLKTKASKEAKTAEAESEAERKYFIFTSDANLRPFVQDANEFLARLNKEENSYKKNDHEKVRTAIANAKPPDNYNDRQKDDFEQAKVVLLGELSEKTARFTGAREREEVKRHKENVGILTDLMRTEDYDGIEKFFNTPARSDMERSTYSEALAEAIDNLELEIAANPNDPELARKHEHMMEFAMEYALERIISQGDAAPTNEYPRFNLYQSDNIDRITQLARVYDERRRERHPNEAHLEKDEGQFFQYIVSLTGLRRAMHELFRGMKDEKTYLGFVTGLLRKGGLAFVEKRITGVSDVQMVYEQLLGSALAFNGLKNKGWLTDQDMEKVDKEVLGVLSSYIGKDFFKRKIVDSEGKISDRPMRQWEINRARLMGRSLSAASQRRLVYEVLGDVPSDGPVSYKSLESEFIARRLALFKLIPERFFSQPESVKQLELLEEELKRDTNSDLIRHDKYGWWDGKEEHGLYANSQRALAFLDTGVTDPKSNGWRQNLLFLRQRGYEINAHGHKMHLGEFLEHVGHDAHEAGKKGAKGLNAQEKLAKSIFNGDKELQRVIRDQRLFLGILVRNNNLNEKNKQIIWNNVARFLPSRIAAFFPEETLKIAGGEQKWLSIRNKLFMAETARVKNDAKFAKTGQGRNKELQDFYQEAGLSVDEINVVKNIIAFGQQTASARLAKMSFPFVAFLDDAPETGWDELSDEDYDRILVNDQSAFAEGYGNIVGIIAHTVKKPEDIVEALHATVEKTEQPLGIETAQKKLEPIVNAILRMRRSNSAAKWAGTLLKMARLPRSEIEKYNLQAEIAEDEADQKSILEQLAQLDVISDDPNDKDNKGRTMFWRELDRNKADRKHQYYRMVRIFILLFGAEFVKAFLGSGILDDIEEIG